MNLHLTYDNQFIDFIIRASHALGSDDRFIIYTNEHKTKLDSVKSEVPFAQFDSQKFKDLVGDVKQYDRIYIHWLEGRIVEFVNQLPDESRVIWCFWGGDGLEFDELLPWVYQPKSFAYFKKTQRFRLSQLPQLRTLLYRRRMKKFNTSNHLAAIQRVNYFAHYLPEDYIRICAVTGMTAKFIPFHYAALEDLVDIHSPIQIKSGTNLLLGNSDTLTNNHFEAIDILAKIDLQGRKVFCPLSYENGEYAKEIASYGAKKLGHDFVPMIDFMPREEYNKILSGISVAIMNHNRSQALGNIVSLLWNGTKLYMSNESTLYVFLKSQGFIVFPINELFEDDETLSKPLSINDIQINRDGLIRSFGRIVQLDKICAMLQL